MITQEVYEKIDGVMVLVDTEFLPDQPPSTSIPNYPVWIKISKSHTDFQTAGLTNDIEIYSMPAGCVIHGVNIKSTVQFAGTLITSYTLSVGIAGNLDKYASAFSVLTPVSDTNFQLSQNFFLENFGSSTSIRAQAISVGGLLNDSTQGEVDFYLLLSNPKS